jgi:FHA domain
MAMGRESIRPPRVALSAVPPRSSRLDDGPSAVAILGNTGPEELVAAAKRPQSEFLTLYGHGLLLLVCIPEPDRSLVARLRVTAMRDDMSCGPGTPVPALAGRHVDSFDSTRTVPHADESAVQRRGLAQQLASRRHFVVPIRKRIAAEASHPTRVSVGRAPNKDIVLGHESVSRSHCWFEGDIRGNLFVFDEESKNSTRLNGKPVMAPQTLVQAGDTLLFGTIEATLCSPNALWTVLAAAAKRRT